MRPDRVVVDAPPLDEHLCFSQRVEDLSVEQFISQLAVEGLAVAVLPGAPWRDVNRLRTEPSQPLPELLSNHLRAVVRADVLIDLLGERRREGMGRGWSEVPEWIFPSQTGGPLDRSWNSASLGRCEFPPLAPDGT